MNEDKLTTTLIEHYQESELSSEDKYPIIVPEAEYNNYGQRGFADLYVNDGDFSYVYEIKSDTAVRSATGANQIIRQFNRMRNNFFPGTDYKPRENVLYELSFIPSPTILEHILENEKIYQEVPKTPASPQGSWARTRTIITLRIPDSENFTPTILFAPGTSLSDFLTHGSVGDNRTPLLDFVTRQNSVMGDWLAGDLP